MIKLLSPSTDYSDEYNAWLASIPNYIYPIVFIIKRFYKPEWNGDWRSHFGVDIVNGFPGNELKFEDRKLIGTYLRVGLLEPAAWRTYKVRQDFAAASKVQTEDDISASVVVPVTQLVHDVPMSAASAANSRSIANTDCSSGPMTRSIADWTSRPKLDMARPDNFISNFEPITRPQARRWWKRSRNLTSSPTPMRQTDSELRQAGKGLVGFLGQPATGRWQAEQEPALFADSSGSDRPDEPLRRRTRNAAVLRDSRPTSRSSGRSMPS